MLYFIIGIIIWGIAWGIVCLKVAKNKGIDDGTWFIWGLLFGLLAFFVVISKPNKVTIIQDFNGGYISNSEKIDWVCPRCRHYNAGSISECICGQQRPIKRVKEVQVQESKNDWKCMFCGKVNAEYVGTCGCGKTKQDSVRKLKAKTKDAHCDTQLESLELLRKYKELLDIGAITQEEFDNKKKDIIC